MTTSHVTEKIIQRTILLELIVFLMTMKDT